MALASLADRADLACCRLTVQTGAELFVLIFVLSRSVSLDDEQAKEKEEYIFLSSKDGDLRSMDETKGIFEKYKPTHVIHLAARVSYDENYNSQWTLYVPGTSSSLPCHAPQTHTSKYDTLGKFQYPPPEGYVSIQVVWSCGLQTEQAEETRHKQQSCQDHTCDDGGQIDQIDHLHPSLPAMGCSAGSV